MSLEKLEHVSAGLGDCSHLGDDREVVDDKANLVLLVAGKGLSMAKKTEAYKKNGEIASEWNFYAQNTFSETSIKQKNGKFRLTQARRLDIFTSRVADWSGKGLRGGFSDN